MKNMMCRPLHLAKRLTRNFRRVFALVLLWLLLILQSANVAAQNQPELPSYWQYSTSGQLGNVLTSDVDLDGVEEFLIVDENNHVDLINSSGKPLWNFIAPDSVTAVGIVDIGESGESQPTIVIGIPNELILLSADGKEIWRTSIIPSANQSTNSSIGETPRVDVDPPGLDSVPIDIASYDQKSDGRNEILVLLNTGNLFIFDDNGEQIQQFADLVTEELSASPLMLVSDLDQDGQEEIVVAVFNPRRFGQLAFFDNDRVLWDLSLSRIVTDLQLIKFREDSQPLVAVGTTSGHVYLYDYLRRRHWLRTLNTPVTSLAEVKLPGQSILAVGTDAGIVAAFDEQGRRLWTTQLAENPDRQVLALSAAPAVIKEREPVLAATLETTVNSNEADAFLINSKGEVSTKISNVGIRGRTQFVDSNHDKNNELLISRFATLELLGMGVGNTGNVQEWEYALNAAPITSLVADLDGDGNDELVFGTQDGRVHNLNSNRSINWLHDAGGPIHSLAILEHSNGRKSGVIVVAQNDQDGEIVSSRIQLRDEKGERVWERDLSSPLTSLITTDIIQGDRPEIVVGTEDGSVIVLSSAGETLWETKVFDEKSVNHLAHLDNESYPNGEIIASGNAQLIGLDITDPNEPVRPIISFQSDITGIYPLGQSGDQEQEGVSLVVSTADGFFHGLGNSGGELSQMNWPIYIGETITAVAKASDNASVSEGVSQFPLLLGTNSGALVLLDIVDDIPLVSWEFQGLGHITDVYWRDQSGDGIPDIAMVGNQNGEVSLYEEVDTESPLPVAESLEHASAIFDVATVTRDANQASDLLITGENGLVQFFRSQENRPPLLTNPVIEAERGQYSVSVNVIDVEGDKVIVTLEVQDPETNAWLAQDTQQLSDGFGTLFWALPSPPASPHGLRYRFIYSDGSRRWTMAPPPGPPPILTSPWSNTAPFLAVGFTAVGLILAIAYIRQSQTPGARASKFYQQLREDPSHTLLMLEQHFRSDNPQVLIPLIASQARNANDTIVTELVDGLFLLPERPLSGLPIINRTLNSLPSTKGNFYDGQIRWQQMFRTSQTLLEAPSITELSLLHPQLEQLVTQLKAGNHETSVFELLSPILSNLRASERVDLAEDRLVYLNDAAALLRQAKSQLPALSPSIETMQVNAIIRRWSGLVSAEIEDIQGRAELTVTLKTSRLVPSDQTTVALEIFNSGRSVAENLVATLDESLAYIVRSDPQKIAYLPPGRMREVRFVISPQVSDRFRISMTVTFSDRNSSNREIAFGDMVNLLPPVRDFSSIANPYTPGTPLRQDSLLFFGRKELFNFVAENAGDRSYRNVLILVGQRRTGKTSALLRLEDHLPPHLVPVYFDCQSLGVVPGMPALLEEFAWHIADTLARRGINLTVPGLEEWQKDPTRLFQREFLPQVRLNLPKGTTLLLVFDEFEAFEALVAEGILPLTFFTYLRHLMQHSDQLNFIFVGTRRLEEMTTDYWSVLFNIALYRKIGFLDVESATRLITEPVGTNLIYDDLALDKILRVTAGHPYFLQLVCYTLVKQANEERSGYVTVSNVNAAVDEMLSLGEVHFAYLWQRSSEAERAILAAVAHLMDHTLPFRPEELIQKLEPYDIHLDPAEITSALNSLVDRDILREVTEEAKSLYELKLGLVGLWIARNKSLSKLYAGENNRTNGRHKGEPIYK